jgi:hypothetical protein
MSTLLHGCSFLHFLLFFISLTFSLNYTNHTHLSVQFQSLITVCDGCLGWGFRWALTGRDEGLQIPLVIKLLGKERSLTRLKSAHQKLLQFNM